MHLSLTVCFFTVKYVFQGRADIAKAQKYIEEHWQDEFDIDKEKVEMTPAEYRKKNNII